MPFTNSHNEETKQSAAHFNSARSANARFGTSIRPIGRVMQFMRWRRMTYLVSFTISWFDDDDDVCFSHCDEYKTGGRWLAQAKHWQIRSNSYQIRKNESTHHVIVIWLDFDHAIPLVVIYTVNSFALVIGTCNIRVNICKYKNNSNIYILSGDTFARIQAHAIQMSTCHLSPLNKTNNINFIK